MGFDVNITTKVKLFDLVCPHSCRGCGAIGAAFCDCCKNYILDEHINYCLNCKRPLANGKCDFCNLPPTFMVGWRDEQVGKLVEDYKYHSLRSLAPVLAELLDGCLPFAGTAMTIVPLPTISRHIRERGFDHTLLLAKKLGQLRRWKVQRLLERAKNNVQVGADELTRKKQAVDAYRVCGRIDPDATYLLLDDVWTTGASMRAAIKMLQQAGASKIVVAVLAVNRLK